MLTTLPSRATPLLTEDELASLMREHGPAVLRLARSYLGDADLAEDVFQDVFLRAYRSARGLRDSGAIKTWLLSVTANRCKDILRSWPQKNLVLAADPPEVAAEPDEIRLGGDTELVAAVFALPQQYREVVLLHYYEELSPAEIARVLGVPTVTVRTRLHRARRALRSSLTEEVLVNG